MARGPLIILAGVRELSVETCWELRKRAIAGSWLIYESGSCFSSPEESLLCSRILNRVFGLEVLPTIVTAGSCIEYSWPARRLVRSFQAATPIRCHSSEVIAEFGGVPVCARRCIGRGGIVYLGSMLGPGLFAEEREAQSVGIAMLT
ncbi:MAG: hypothetical protein WB992_24175 [Bryobacteraceae bacterium]